MITDSHIFDNSMQIKYEFIFVVYEYISHLIFFQSHFLIIITSGNSLPTCEHTPNQQSRNQRNQSNFVEAVLIPHGEVLIGFEHRFFEPKE